MRRYIMAGSHTIMPGIIFSGNAVLNVTNATSGITNNPQTITIPFNHQSLNGGLGINGHTNNVITTTNILRPANKIIVQGNPNSLTYLHSQSNSPIFSSLNQVIQASNNGILEKESGHNYINILNRLPDGNKKLEIISTSSPLVHSLNTTGLQAINSSGIYAVTSSAIRSINSSEVQPVNSLVHHVNSLVQPVNSLVTSVNSLVQPINSLVHPVNSLVQSVNSSVQPVTLSVQSGISLAHPANSLVHPNNLLVQPVNSLVHTVPLSAVNTSNTSDENIDKEGDDSDIEEIPQEKEIMEEEEEPVIDIMINNVVCSFSVGCHLNLRNIALTARNVEFRKENGMVTLKLRRPQTTASIWSSGKITCTGSTSEEQARIAARRVARALQKLGYNVKFRNYRIVNVLGTCTMPFAIRIANFSQMHRRNASYEPELHPGVTYRIESPKATLKIFSTGSITVTAPSVSNVQSAIETIYPLVKEFSKPRSQEELSEIRRLQKRRTLKEEEENEVILSDEDN